MTAAQQTKKTWMYLVILWLLIAWIWIAQQGEHWSRDFAMVAAGVIVVVLVARATSKPATVQLVVRLGNDSQDSELFRQVHRTFKQECPPLPDLWFDGFDTDGEWVWFYFNGPDAVVIREKVLVLLKGFSLPPGSHFQVLGE